MIKKSSPSIFNTLKLNLKHLLIPLSIFVFLAPEKAFGQCNPRQDSLVLAELYTKTKGDRWFNTLRNEQKWTVKGVPIENWYGITLRDGCVININLKKNNLQDSLPNLDLPYLELLSLDSNELTGRIPNFNLPELTAISLENNKLNGAIPNLKLSKLKFLSLSNNFLSETIPNFNLPELIGLYLGNNQLSGQIPFLILKELKELYLYSNQFTTSTLPNFNLPNLEELSLFNCQLNTTIPNFNLRKLRFLSLANNKLKGCIPREIRTNCPSIGEMGGDISNNSSLGTQHWVNYWRNFNGACSSIGLNNCRYNDSIQLLDLYNKTDGANWVNKWDLTRPMTTWSGITLNTEGCVTDIKLDKDSLRGVLADLSFSKLRTLSLAFNQLSGNLPNLNLSSLVRIDLTDNQLTGPIPNFNKLPILQDIDLDYNKFSGAIPNFDSLPNLLFMDFTGNELSGAIPNFNKLPKLKSLHLRNNKNLSDTIPNFKLTDLFSLRLHDCSLQGALPDLKTLTKLSDIQVYNNKLKGCFPVSYLKFCTTISDSTKRNFSKNDSLGLVNSSGDFSRFCRASFVTNSKTKSIYLGDTLHYKGQIERPQNDAVYQDTIILEDCRVGLNIINVTVKQKDTLSTSIKTSITPNGDGIYDQLDLQELVDWSLFPDSELSVFNRWGQKVYFASPYKQDWNGQSSEGKDLLNGDYFFILNLKPKGRTIKGSVYLNR